MAEGRQTLSSTLPSQPYTGGAVEKQGAISEGKEPFMGLASTRGERKVWWIDMEGGGLLDQGIFQVPAS